MSRMIQGAIGWPYVTGFFDGEGHIGIQPRPKNPNANPIVSLAFTNTHKETLEQLSAFLQVGRIYNHRVRANRKPAWDLIINHHGDVLRAAKAMLPYSITKRDQLENQISLIEGLRWSRRSERCREVKH